MITPGAIPLYLFAKAPVAGQAKKRLCPPLDFSESAKVASALLAHAINAVESNWPGQSVLSVTPDTKHAAFSAVIQSNHWRTTVQSKLDLGCRMCESLEQGVELAGSAAVLGTDIPSINRDILQQAFNGLARGQQVIGPTADGGFYLLGMNQSPRALFQGIRWGTDEVYAKLMENAQANGVYLKALPILSDCDYYEDLQAAANTLPDFAKRLTQAGFDLGLLNLHPLSS